MAEAVVSLKGVGKAYGGSVRTVALDHVDLELRHGEFAALIGPSGSGKSTLLNLIGLLDRQSFGAISVAGCDTRRLDEAALTRHRGRSIGFVFQAHHLLPAFSALENVMLPMAAARGHFTDEMVARGTALLDELGLADRAHHRATQLSGGQQQRVAIARALALSPPLVLADEPTGNLDTHSSNEVFESLRELNRTAGVTFLIVTHDRRLADWCDRVIELVDGRVLRDSATTPPGSPRDPPSERERAPSPRARPATSPRSNDGVERVRRRVGLAGALVAAWGVLGHVALLLMGASKLLPVAVAVMTASPPSGGRWAYGAASAAFMAYFQGYRGLQLRFAPLVVGRAAHFARNPGLLRALLAPAYSMGLVYATRRRMLVSWGLLLSMAGIGMLAARLPEPHRGVVDLGVATGLAWGALALTIVALRALVGHVPRCDLSLPADGAVAGPSQPPTRVISAV